MAKYCNNINDYQLIDPFKGTNEQQNQNAINGYLTYSSKKNGPMYIGPATQANLLKELIDVFVLIIVSLGLSIVDANPGFSIRMMCSNTNSSNI